MDIYTFKAGEDVPQWIEKVKPIGDSFRKLSITFAQDVVVEEYAEEIKVYPTTKGNPNLIEIAGEQEAEVIGAPTTCYPADTKYCVV